MKKNKIEDKELIKSYLNYKKYFYQFLPWIILINIVCTISIIVILIFAIEQNVIIIRPESGLLFNFLSFIYNSNGFIIAIKVFIYIQLGFNVLFILYFQTFNLSLILTYGWKYRKIAKQKIATIEENKDNTNEC